MVNRVILVGRVGVAAKVTERDGSQVTSFTLVTSRFVATEGRWVEAQTYHWIEWWGAAGARAAHYLIRDAQVYVEGSLRSQTLPGRQVPLCWVNPDKLQILGDTKARGVGRVIPGESPVIPEANAENGNLPF